MSDIHAEPPRKVCPSCGSEFQPWVERCVDCEVPLVTPEEAASRPAAAAAEEPGWEEGFEPGQELVLLRSEKTAWIRRLASELEAEGIPFHLEPGQHGGDLALYVTPEDLEDARRFDAAIYRQEVLDTGGAARLRPRQEARPPRRPAADGSAAPAVKVCPSCGGEYQSWAERCADCDVPLILSGSAAAGRAETKSGREHEHWEDGEDPSSYAGAERAEQEGRCPACGAALPPHPQDCPECGLALGAPPGAADLDER